DAIDQGAHATNTNLAIFFIGSTDYLTLSADQDPTSLHIIASELTDNIIAAVNKVNAQLTVLIGAPM
ncbi:hypothetical protein NAI44_10210, partial [Francisella tularensis subsp. holarctica]|nr:hypothetical protein [Francisella tularensis subsp. holarctica]